MGQLPQKGPVPDFFQFDMRFQVIFTYDSEYKGYVADVPELPGC